MLRTKPRKKPSLVMASDDGSIGKWGWTSIESKANEMTEHRQEHFDGEYSRWTVTKDKVNERINLDDVRDETGRVLDGPYKHIRVLERRMNFLHQRIERGKKDGKNLSHDEHEREALEWAINAVYTHVPLPEKE